LGAKEPFFKGRRLLLLNCWLRRELRVGPKVYFFKKGIKGWWNRGSKKVWKGWEWVVGIGRRWVTFIIGGKIHLNVSP